MAAPTNVPSGPPTTDSDDVKSQTKGARLIPMDLSAAAEETLLREQRVLCGWNHDKVPLWKDLMSQGQRTLFWITIPASLALQTQTQTLAPLVQRGEEKIHAVGHVSLDRTDTPDPGVAPDTDLASGDGTVLTITSLFVLPAFSSLGLGAFAMDTCERLAREEPFGSTKCRAVTVGTLSPRYFAGGVEGEDGMGRWALLGLRAPERSTAPWYVRRGYVLFKDQKRATSKESEADPSKHGWYFAYLRKELGEGV